MWFVYGLYFFLWSLTVFRINGHDQINSIEIIFLNEKAIDILIISFLEMFFFANNVINYFYKIVLRC